MVNTATLDRTPTLKEQKLQERDNRRPMERDESPFLISAGKVEDTDVFASDGEKIGKVEDIMIGKRSGQVEYAVMSFGGFLGIGEEYHPLPWDVLDYDTAREGYVVNIDKDRLREAPRFSKSSDVVWNRDFGNRVFSYYGMTY